MTVDTAVDEAIVEQVAAAWVLSGVDAHINTDTGLYDKLSDTYARWVAVWASPTATMVAVEHMLGERPDISVHPFPGDVNTAVDALVNAYDRARAVEAAYGYVSTVKGVSAGMLADTAIRPLSDPDRNMYWKALTDQNRGRLFMIAVLSC